MINRRLATNFLRDAQLLLKEARTALSRRHYHRAIRLSQEAFELAAKSSLRAIGVEYPKAHEVSDALLATKEKLPEWMRREITGLVKASTWLAERRGPSMYGDEIKGVPASRLFTRTESAKAVRYAEAAVRMTGRLLKDLFRGTT